ncbi:disintegrin and metalloproteinase domain-containing protein 28-like [Rhinatrema bivittatum]|uniref:disintegrin and metalloproteinase domain-containing protein 28-like n=1 Tax=Rhinatrema bivittatum TaxID=194408 RepID=UPI00112E4567|nr:disintegrin and metalloproteinase domain-containing protein 28-like [Rhinatrema bivittatum]
MLQHRLLLLLLILATAVQASFIRPPPTVKYEVVHPQNIYAQYKEDMEGEYPAIVQYKLKIDGKEQVLHLEKTNDLTANNFTETYYLENGQEVTTSLPTMDHCNYQGYIQEEDNSLVSISTCNGLSGFLKVRDQKYGITPLQLADHEEHAIYNYESLENASRFCGVTSSSWDVEQALTFSPLERSHKKEEMLKKKKKKYVELYVIADNTMYKKYHENITATKERIFELVNNVNVVYREINIFVTLVGYDIWTQTDFVEISPDIGVTLDNFASWRSEVLLKRKDHDHAQLLTNLDFKGPQVGLAYVGTMCSEDQSAGVIQDFDANAMKVGATMAHELGHSFGMNHDNASCSCTSSPCIMTPIISNIPGEFSNCSLRDVKNFISYKSLACIRNVPSPGEIKTRPICGNSIVETGEECDCGTLKECINPCCDPNNCTFKEGAKCADGGCCENCNFKSAGFICRPLKEECDLEDVCDGQSAHCPADKYKEDGTPCKDNRGYCYKGRCPTLQDQCVAVWGKDANVASDKCYTINLEGFIYGFCKMNKDKFIPCTKQNMKCGKLYCSGGADLPTFGSTASYRDCKTSYHAKKIIGLVESGTKCEDEKVCSDSQCVDVAQAYGWTNCTAKCKGHAVCDNELQCHCEKGWAPPDCDKPLIK